MKTIKQVCLERGLDEETAYAILIWVKRALYFAEQEDLKK